MELKKLRKDIDKIDKQMKKLFLERMEVAKNIAATKREQGLPIFQPEREAEVLEKRSEDVPEEMKDIYKKFLQSVMDISKEVQRKEI